ncbi:MAG TPA: hypothetical protein VGM63_11960 [Mucilaginibacter sp.]|jgi:hypothetical protein
MSEIKSLADQLRGHIDKAAAAPEVPEILQRLRAFDNSNHKSLMHVRFDGPTLKTLGHFKMATGVDVTKLVAFSVHHLFEQYPELKTIIKQYIQAIDL